MKRVCDDFFRPTATSPYVAAEKEILRWMRARCGRRAHSAVRERPREAGARPLPLLVTCSLMLEEPPGDLPHEIDVQAQFDLPCRLPHRITLLVVEPGQDLARQLE